MSRWFFAFVPLLALGCSRSSQTKVRVTPSRAELSGDYAYTGRLGSDSMILHLASNGEFTLQVGTSGEVRGNWRLEADRPSIQFAPFVNHGLQRIPSFEADI